MGIQGAQNCKYSIAIFSNGHLALYSTHYALKFALYTIFLMVPFFNGAIELQKCMQKENFHFLKRQNSYLWQHKSNSETTLPYIF